MITVAHAVNEIVSSSDFAIEGMQNGCLNYSEYAKLIKAEVERLTKKPVQLGSIVMALSRLGRTYFQQNKSEKFTFYNLANRTGLTELAYDKSTSIQSAVSKLHSLEIIKETPFFVSTVGLNEIAIVTSSDLIPLLIRSLSPAKPKIIIEQLASLTMQVGLETIDVPRQSYTVIKQLALRDISIVEYTTSPSELTVIVREKDIKQAFSILYDTFFAT